MCVGKETVTGHSISFLKTTTDEMDQYPHMKGYYIVMDNASIRTSEDIDKYILSRSYFRVYLPSYFPELNPIEQFWSVVTSRLKRNKFLEKKTLMTRMSEASNSLKLGGFKGFIWNSHKCLDKCPDK
jgi:transposase